MRVTLVRSGGLAGLRQVGAVDEAALGPAERQELRALLAAAGFFGRPATVTGPAPAPDRLRYRIAVEDGGRRHQVVAAEEALDEALRALVRWLEARAFRR